MGNWTHVTIDFETSHLVFPKLIGAILLALGLAILATRRRQILAMGGYWADILARMDRFRFCGTLVLTILYFTLMEPVGEIWPNTGLGFLACSIPYVLLTGVLFLHDRSFRAIVPVATTAAVAPPLVWWTFTRLFFMTLP